MRDPMRDPMKRLLRSSVLFVTLILLGIGLMSCGKSIFDEVEEAPAVSETDSWPYPKIKGGDFRGEKNFAYLINNYAKGRPEPTPWVGYWWPYTTNGIAGGKYSGGSSPAGKYDAARGNTTSAQSWEARNHGSGVPKLASWWGHCNGWSAAAALFPEPREPVRVNGIEFSVGDVKALLTEAAMEVSADFFGDRVDWGSDFSSPKMYDTVPDQYFLVLTTYAGRLKQGVLMDRFTLDQVWNQPIVGYSFDYPTPADYLGADPEAPNVYRIQLTSTIWWARDEVVPDTINGPFDWQVDEHFDSRTLKMEIWLDGPVVFGADGKITSSGNVIVTRKGDFLVGGAWKMGEGYADAWPDYMWIPFSVTTPTEYANPYVDVEWLKKHLLVPGGADDPSVRPGPVQPAPSVRPSTSPSGFPDNPDPWPTPTSTVTPRPTFTPDPEPTRDPWPTPTSTGGPWPFPTATGTPEPRPTSPGPLPTGPGPVTPPRPNPRPTR